jgi:rSAM/selenodomain-associated transferase 1
MADRRSDEARSALAIMAKAPRPGEVKTRLCPPLSYREAAELYRCLLLDKIAQINTLHWATPVVSYSPEEARPLFEDLTPPRFLLIPQRGDGLGARLLSTFDQLFQHGYTQVMVIDSDTPTLPTAYLEQALGFFGDRETDVVLGPTEDGGYFLIGLRQSYPVLFEHMPWSTAHVMPETLRRAAQHVLKVACTASWYDIDTPDDLTRLAQSFDQVPMGLARHTRRFFQEFRR